MLSFHARGHALIDLGEIIEAKRAEVSFVGHLLIYGAAKIAEGCCGQIGLCHLVCTHVDTWIENHPGGKCALMRTAQRDYVGAVNGVKFFGLDILARWNTGLQPRAAGNDFRTRYCRG